MEFMLFLILVVLVMAACSVDHAAKQLERIADAAESFDLRVTLDTVLHTDVTVIERARPTLLEELTEQFGKPAPPSEAA